MMEMVFYVVVVVSVDFDVVVVVVDDEIFLETEMIEAMARLLYYFDISHYQFRLRVLVHHKSLHSPSPL